MAERATPGLSPASRQLPLPQRCRRHGVGKEIGGAVYVHRSYEHVFGSALDEARSSLPPDFCYTVVKLNRATMSFSLAGKAGASACV